MSPPRIIRPEDALENLKLQRMKEIEGYLEQVGNIVTIENQAMDLVLKAELGIHGVPTSHEGREQLVSRCAEMARLVSEERLKRYNHAVRDVCVLKNVSELPDFVLWAAQKAAGVDLLEKPKAEEPPPPKDEAN